VANQILKTNGQVKPPKTPKPQNPKTPSNVSRDLNRSRIAYNVLEYF